MTFPIASLEISVDIGFDFVNSCLDNSLDISKGPIELLKLVALKRVHGVSKV